MQLLSDKFDTFGLDIGDRALKIAYVSKDGSRKKLASYGAAVVPPGASERGEIKDAKTLAALLGQLLRGAKGKRVDTNYVHACLPETQTFIKLINVAPKNEAELPAAIRDEIQNHIPIEPDELYLDWRMVGLPKKKGVFSVLVGAIPKTIADSYTEFLLQCGLKPVSLQIEAEAISRSLLPAGAENASVSAIVDIGEARASFIAARGAVVDFSVTLPISSGAFTAKIAKTLKLSLAEAEKAKKICGLDPVKCEGALRAVLDPEINLLAKHIKSNLDYYQEHFPGETPIRDLILTGGGANLVNLAAEISNRLPETTVYLGRPLLNFSKKSKLKKIVSENPGSVEFLHNFTPDKDAASEEITDDASRLYTTAIGLALTDI